MTSSLFGLFTAYVEALAILVTGYNFLCMAG